MPSDDQASTHSRQLRLKARPQGEVRDSDFELIASPIPELEESQFLVKITHISIDPAMRGWMSEARSYLPPVQLGDVMRALAVGLVVASRHTDYSAGDWVHGAFGIQEHAVSNGNGVYKIDVTETLT